MSTPDLGLAIPLHGTQLIEASAGTGKTYTLATLYVRLVLEARCTVPQILAVTFTVAATAELRTRLRERLALALSLADGSVVADAASDATASLVHAALAREARDALVQRLRAAVESMDLAPIHTIHAFCQRALADHALEAAQPLAPRTLVSNEATVLLDATTAFWRSVSYDDADADVLLEHWTSPQDLADDLRGWLAHDAIEPVLASPPRVADAILVDATAALLDAARTVGDTAIDSLHAAFHAGVMNKVKFPAKSITTRASHLLAWRDAPDTVPLLREKIDWFTPEGLRERAKDAARVPESPLFDAIAAWLAATESVALERARRRIAFVHRACAFVRSRQRELKRQRAEQGFDDLVREVDEALQGPGGAAFARRLRAQFRVALVDEFQDTDPRQWSIFRHVFGDAPPDDGGPRALVLIGDPKQSIYRFRGGDVFTYLAAAAGIPEQNRHTLDRNFRSRPSVLRAVEALFSLGGDAAFAQEDIRFVPVSPGGRCADDALRIDGAVAPALTVLTLEDVPKQRIDATRDAAAVACASRIHALLDAARNGRAARGSDDDARPLRPGDIAVLVRNNSDALRMQRVLASIGVPSVAPARDTVFASEEAEEWRRLLLAITAPGDDGRLRAALATPLLGRNAADLAALDHDTATQRDLQDLAQAWRQQLDAQGILALGNALCAEHAPRLLALADGERRLTNHLQLLDALQCDPAAALGPRALLDALERRMREADANNEDEQLRLESDADRVTILTLHRSKGLEFDLVFLPFLATDAAPQPRGLLAFHDGTRRVGWLTGGGDTAADAHALQRHRAEDHAEALRLLYVGLTRARLGLWLAWGASRSADASALAWLLHRDADALAASRVTAESIAQRLALLQAAAPGTVQVEPAAVQLPPTRLAPLPAPPTPPAALPTREITRDWWIYSYSQLAREDAGSADTVDDERGAGDEDATPPLIAPVRSPFVGARFGNSLHHALEHVDMTRWRDWRDDTPPPGEHAALVDALRSESFPPELDDEGVPLLATLVRNTLNVRLPGGVRLADLPDTARRNELEFHLGLAPVAVPALLDVLHRHGIAAARQGFGPRRRIEGLLTGRIDLVYRHDGRYVVLDYKSNQLADYAPDALDIAVRDSEYDLQYALYAVALHRWLRFRLGDGYDPARDFGGVVYLYCRGLDAGRDDGIGIHAPQIPLALLHDLDALFADRHGDAA